MEQTRVLQLHEMELNSASSCSSYGDEDAGFIDMEVTSVTSPRFRSSPGTDTTPIQSREFEFQMGNVTHEKESSTCCPADELFYKGRLLPLHLPPRLQMVEKLTLNNTATATATTSIALDGATNGVAGHQQQFRNPLFGSATAPCTNSNTPLESCNISPSESCRASTELNPDEYFFNWSTEISSLIARDTNATHTHHQCLLLHRRNSWSRKIKHSSLGKKLKASRAYLKSLFNKSVCSNEVCGKSTCNADQDQSEAGCVLKAKECVNRYIKVTRKKPFESLQHEKFNISSLLLQNSKEMVDDGQTRKSFSGAINWNNAPTTTKCSSTTNSSGSTPSSSSSSSSSISFNFNGFYELKLLKRSSSGNSDLDSSVEGAIAHCKQSQKL